MSEADPSDEISRIEDRIEDLAEIAERCRRIILGSKVAIGGGFAALVLTILGYLGARPDVAFASIALILGGIVSFGSNVSTLRQTEAAIGTADARRSELINRINPRVVGDAPVKLM